MRHELQTLVWQAVDLAEQCLVIAYVVGVLPAAFSGDPYLFVDTLRCCLSALCATLSACAMLGLWTLHSQRDRLKSLAGLLGSWQRCGTISASAARGHEWSPRRSYPSGSIVAYHGCSYKAKGKFEANLAQPGSKAASALQLLVSGNSQGLVIFYNWALALQTGLVGLMVLVASVRRHFVVEMFVALLNSPSVLLFIFWRRDALNQQ